MTINRWYVRCVDCLSVAAVDSATEPPKADCSLCAGRIEVMGRVRPATPWHRASLVQDVRDTACDWKCTSARGPCCACTCGGKNHGTGRTVSVVVGLGSLPRVAMPTSEHAQRMAADYRAAKQTARDELTRVLSLAGPTGWLSPIDFARRRQIERAFGDAYRARTHSTRMRVLSDLRCGPARAS